MSGMDSQRTVLVVDDEEAIAEAVRARLASEGFRVVVAADGPQAIDKHRTERPDLVVLDLMLPGMDGLEVCRVIQRDEWVPVLMLTARTEEADKIAGFAVGADDYLTKPFSLRELVVRVRLGEPPMKALVSATRVNAEILGMSDRLGTLEAGKAADVIAVPGDPSKDIGVVEKVGFVMRAGVVYREDLARK